MHGVIYCNPAIPWQAKYSKAFKQGLENHLIPAKITSDKYQIADIRILLGPHWGVSDGLIIDRAFWGDPDCVSIHWLVKGKKVYEWEPKEGRHYPDLKPMKKGAKTLVLCDYGKRYQYPGTIRLHPSEAKQGPLIDALESHDIACGGRSTAMVEAAIQGLRVITQEDNTPIQPIKNQTAPDRESWLRALSWHNWAFEEIKKGDIWPHFLKLKP